MKSVVKQTSPNKHLGGKEGELTFNYLSNSEITFFEEQRVTQTQRICQKCKNVFFEDPENLSFFCIPCRSLIRREFVKELDSVLRRVK
ncbi:MAG: hypothetical protein A2V66_10625 [Ignavibacteria bacterium RBG_13_36_8]|nr:MAG: hypothetical protein A2V66_10625 [Ignavibacteria bacterium RBG_13_36_8]